MHNLSKSKKEMDALVIETLYMEDDMLSKLEIVLELNESIVEIQIKIEDVYRQIFQMPGFSQNTAAMDKSESANEFIIFKAPLSKPSHKNLVSNSRSKIKPPIHNIQFSTSSSDDNSESERSISPNKESDQSMVRVISKKRGSARDDYIKPANPFSVCYQPNMILYDSINNFKQVVQ